MQGPFVAVVHVFGSKVDNPYSVTFLIKDTYICKVGVAPRTDIKKACV